jgi:hypothetical protein
MYYKLLGVFIQYFEGMYMLFSASTHWLTEYLAYTTFRMMITQSGQNLQFESLNCISGRFVNVKSQCILDPLCNTFHGKFYSIFY